MTKLRLCVGRRAKQPYFLNTVCVNIYSIEEMCYLLALNPFMITNEIMSSDLVDWFENECGLNDLADELRSLLRRGLQLSRFIDTILDYAGYCDESERLIIRETLKSNSGLNDLERKKNQADYLIRNGKYELAIEEYEALLNTISDVDNSLRPKLYQNIGYAYARLFMFDVAARYYRRAYDITKDIKLAVMYLGAVRMYMSEDKYLSFIAERGELKEASLKLEQKLNQIDGDFEGSRESLMLSALSIYKGEGNVSSYYEEIDKVILGMKEDYLKYVIS